MDLLLFFIQRDKLNIYDIPISHIAEEFLNYIKMMSVMNIDLGEEFFHMSTMLMKIKSKMLLPVSIEDDDELIDDPGTDLVERLVEYKKIKELSFGLENILDFPQLTEMSDLMGDRNNLVLFKEEYAAK